MASIYSSGTSMATPLTTGTAALIRQYFTQRGHSFISAALVKAALINGCIDIAPGQYGTGPFQEIQAAPDGVQGWGRVSLSSSLPLSSVDFPGYTRDYRFIDETTGVSTNEGMTYSFQHYATNSFRVTLTYSDFPGTPASNGALVNNLDMFVIDPSYNIHFPTIPRDAVNNIERAIIESGAPGSYIVVVSGTNVPEGPQPFALAVSGIFRTRFRFTPILIGLQVDVAKFERVEKLLEGWPKYFELSTMEFSKQGRIEFQDFILFVSAYNKRLLRQAIEKAALPTRIVALEKKTWTLTQDNTKYTMSNLKSQIKKNKAFISLNTELTYWKDENKMTEFYHEKWELWRQKDKWVLETYTTTRVK